MPKFSVVIVNWNVSDLLQLCIESIIRTGYDNLEVLIVDNNSTDFDPKVFQKPGLNLKFFQNSTNLGFPKAVNLGLRHAKGDYLVILNPDTEIPIGFFKQCLEFFRRYSDCWLMGPKFLNPDGTLQGSVFPEPSVISTVKEFWLKLGSPTQKYTPNQGSPTKVNCVSGGCFVFPRSTLTKIGYFTEEVFMYYEDLDYCRRIRSMGGSIYFNPEVIITHIHGQSSKKSPKTMNYLQESSKWYNGHVKHYLMWFVSLTGQKLHRLLG